MCLTTALKTLKEGRPELLDGSFCFCPEVPRHAIPHLLSANHPRTHIHAHTHTHTHTHIPRHTYIHPPTNPMNTFVRTPKASADMFDERMPSMLENAGYWLNMANDDTQRFVDM